MAVAPTTTAMLYSVVAPGPGGSNTLLTGQRVDTFRGCTVMPANSVFRADVRNAPVDPRGGQWLAGLGAGSGGKLMAGWGVSWQGATGGIPLNFVAADRAKETVIFNRGYTTSGPSIDDRPYAIPDYPLVEGMPSVPQWDRHLMVFQDGTCISQELYNVANGVELPPSNIGDAIANSIYASNYGATWIAESGVQVDLRSNLYPTKGYADASRIPMIAGRVRPDEISKLYVDHMIAATVSRYRNAGYQWPARAGDGWSTDPNAIPMGAVLRLKSNFNLSAFSPAARAVLEAAQRHGVVIHDSYTDDTPGIRLVGVGNGWTASPAFDQMQREIESVGIENFEAVDVRPFAVDPNTSWQVR